MLSTSSTLLAFATIMVPAMAADFQACGGAMFDPAEYKCYPGNVLCPVVGGEPLLLCGQACYSPYQYECSNGALAALPSIDGPVRLTISNPQIAIHNSPVAACEHFLWASGETCSSCPENVPCPPGDTTVLHARGDLAVQVAGGQYIFLDPYWSVGYTQAHTADIPSGSVTGNTAAYRGGGFMNNNEGALGWRACFPRASGGGDRWTLHAVNATNIDRLTGCPSVNLKVEELPEGTLGAWQYE